MVSFMYGDIASGLVSFSTIAAALATWSFTATPASDPNLPRPLAESDFIEFDRARARIGQFLFYNKILSGNKNISCGTCHHHDLGGSDGLSLGVGEGGSGLGPDRETTDGEDHIV